MHHVRVTLVVTLLLLAGISAMAIAAPDANEETSTAATPTIEHHTVVAHDGALIAITVFRPGDATSDAPVPVVLNSHGWSGSRAKAPTGIVGALLDEGYGVVSFDARGHGESGGEANVHNRDHEVKDFLAILDWIHANLDWVTKQTDTGIPNDFLVGATGGSYGGGYQLMTASYDHRLDALVPEITWNDLTYSLATNGVIKSVWVDALYGAAKASGTRLAPDIDRWFLEANTMNAFPADAFDHFKASSPRPEQISADVLLIQGIPDLLFNLNEAVRNYDALENGIAGDVRLVTHLKGHVLPGVQPMTLGGDRPTNPHPCGDIKQMTLAWFDEHLRGNANAAAAIPEVSYALENGECIELDAPNTATATLTFDTLVAPQGAGTLLVPLLDTPAVVAGIPHIRADAINAVPAILNLGLVLGDAESLRIVDDQSTGIRIHPGATLDADLAGIATRIHEGQTLYLRIDGLNEWYAHNGARLPGAALLTNVEVTLPLVPDA